MDLEKSLNRLLAPTKIRLDPNEPPRDPAKFDAYLLERKAWDAFKTPGEVRRFAPRYDPLNGRSGQTADDLRRLLLEMRFGVPDPFTRTPVSAAKKRAALRSDLVAVYFGMSETHFPDDKPWEKEADPRVTNIVLLIPRNPIDVSGVRSNVLMSMDPKQMGQCQYVILPHFNDDEVSGYVLAPRKSLFAVPPSANTQPRSQGRRRNRKSRTGMRIVPVRKLDPSQVRVATLRGGDRDSAKKTPTPLKKKASTPVVEGKEAKTPQVAEKKKKLQSDPQRSRRRRCKH